MIPVNMKQQLDQLKKQSTQIQTQLNKALESGKVEASRILKELGVESGTEPQPLGEVLNELRAANPSVRELFRKLDVATYDNRFRFKWNRDMMSAYARQQLGKAYEHDIQPRLDQAKHNLEEQLTQINDQWHQVQTEIQSRTQTIRERFSS